MTLKFLFVISFLTLFTVLIDLEHYITIVLLLQLFQLLHMKIVFIHLLPLLVGARQWLFLKSQFINEMIFQNIWWWRQILFWTLFFCINIQIWAHTLIFSKKTGLTMIIIQIINCESINIVALLSSFNSRWSALGWICWLHSRLKLLDRCSWIVRIIDIYLWL